MKVGGSQRVPKTVPTLTVTWEKSGIILAICFSEIPCLFLQNSWKKKCYLFPIIRSLKLAWSIIRFWGDRRDAAENSYAVALKKDKFYMIFFYREKMFTEKDTEYIPHIL